MSDEHVKVLFWDTAECDKCDNVNPCAHIDIFPHIKHSTVVQLCGECLKNILESNDGDNENNIFYNDRGYKCHIVTILHKEDDPQIVYKYYGKTKQWWHYCIESMYKYNLSLESGLYKK